MSSSVRSSHLVLFDIDGTLLSSAGAATRLFGAVLAEVAGRPIETSDYSMAGKTDRLIVRELLTRAGFDSGAVQQMMEPVMERYLARFPAELAASEKARLFPGVRDLLERLAATPEVLLGLLTGNLERGAAIKLDRFGIRHLFRVGAYGSDAEDRRALVAVAVERARALTGIEFHGRRVIIIGDTPHDIDCGRAAGAMTVAVATGPYSVADLEAHRPDVIFSDFTRVDDIVSILLADGEPGRIGR